METPETQRLSTFSSGTPFLPASLQDINTLTQIVEALCRQLLDGVCIVRFDQPVAWGNDADRDAAVDYIIHHSQVVFANDALLHQYGASREQVLGRTPGSFFEHNPAEGREVIAQINDQHHIRLQTNEQRVDGSPMVIEGDYFCLRDADGRITGHLCIQRDITARHLDEQRYRALFEQTHDAVFILSPEGRHLAVNQRACDMLGYTREEFTALPFGAISAEPEQSQSVREQLLSGHPMPLFERQLIAKDGHMLTVEINAQLVRSADGRPLHIQSVVRDITERKRMERALRDAETRQRALLSAIPDLIFRHSRDGTYLDYYAADPADLAAPEDTLVGRTVHEVLPPEVAQIAMSAMHRALDTGETQVAEYSLQLSDGIRYFESHTTPCGDEVMVVVRNVTERRLNALREQTMAVEREQMRLLAQFVRYASHEFRTPLAILGTSLYLAGRSAEDNRRKHHISQAEQQVARITDLLNILMTVIQLDSGGSLDRMPTDMRLLVQEVAAAIRSRAAKKAVTLTLQMPPELPTISAHAAYLALAIEHLLTNALQFTSGGGSITLTMEQHYQDIVIVVADTGTGIPSDAVEHIFDDFYRGDDARTTPGIGLGLTLVRKVIERHGGLVSVSSTLGVGSTFTLCIPISGEQSTALH